MGKISKTIEDELRIALKGFVDDYCEGKGSVAANYFGYREKSFPRYLKNYGNMKKLAELLDETRLFEVKMKITLKDSKKKK